MKEVREQQQQQQGMYRPEFEHDNCGIGAVVNIKGKKTHDTVANALKIVEHLEHRAGKDAEGKTGDGVGILLQISHKFFKKACKKEGFEIGDEREYGIAQFFFPQHEIKRAQAKKMFEIILEKEGLEYEIYSDIKANPTIQNVQHGVEAFKNSGAIPSTCFPSFFEKSWIKLPAKSSMSSLRSRRGGRCI